MNEASPDAVTQALIQMAALFLLLGTALIAVMRSQRNVGPAMVAISGVFLFVLCQALVVPALLHYLVAPMMAPAELPFVLQAVLGYFMSGIIAVSGVVMVRAVFGSENHLGEFPDFPLLLRWVLPGTIGVFVLFYTYQLVLVLIPGIDPTPQAMVEAVVNESVPSTLVMLGLTIVVIAPLVEEFLFRRVLYEELAVSLGTRNGLILSGLLFGVVHDIQVWLPIAVMGGLLAWTLQKTRSLWVPIGIHVGVNGVSFVIAMLASA